jgi:hypothetical protein
MVEIVNEGEMGKNKLRMGEKYCMESKVVFSMEQSTPMTTTAFLPKHLI